ASDTVLPADQDRLLAQIESDLAEANERALRAHAELENFRKRAFRQLEEERKYASLPILRDLLPVVDNLQRAIVSAEKSHDGQGLLEGVKLVAQQLAGVLQQHHCTEMNAKGTLFDPHRHEAIAQLPSEEYPQGTVIDVTQTGYVLHDRVVRAAQVLVSAGPPVSSPGRENGPGARNRDNE
ncbi:MAG: nucleotide exchange factor GrpE, partial [Planctomycetes bacterium]|nr:nucleotide exchange factor GrpE [Planctomycetota bacterium]